MNLQKNILKKTFNVAKNHLHFAFPIILFFFQNNTSDAQVLAGSKYRYKIESVHNKMVLDVPGGSVNANTGIIQWHDWGGNNQRWYFTVAENGLYRIHSANSYLVLDIKNQTPNESVIQNYATLESSQYFSIENLGSNIFSIKSNPTKKALSIKNESTQAGADIVLANDEGKNAQKWKITLIDSIAETHSIINPGICAGIGNQYRIHARSDVHLIWDTPWASKQTGTEIALYEGQGATHQRIYLEEVKKSKFLIYMMHSGFVLQPKNKSLSEGVGIEQSKNDGSVAQQFSFVALGDGYYAIFNESSGLALTKNDKKITQSTYTGSVQQQWKLILTEGTCNNVEAGITSISSYFTKNPSNSCNTVRLFYVVPSDAPQKNRQALCAAAALSQQRTWAKYGYTVSFEPMVVVNSQHDMNWFMTNGGSEWYQYGVNSEKEIMKTYSIDYSKEKLLQFIEGVCSAAAGGGGSASIPGCMIDGMAVGEPNNYGVVGHELGHHMFGTGHPSACEKIFPQDNMCNNVYPANFIYPGSYTDNYIGASNKWVKEKSDCKVELKKCNLTTPLVRYKMDNGNWTSTPSPATILIEEGKSITLSMNPDTLSYYRWYGQKGLIERGDAKGNITLLSPVKNSALGMYRCLGINNEGCSVHIDVTLKEKMQNTSVKESNIPTFDFYPNPATNRLIIQKSQPDFEVKNIVFYNQLGQLVKSFLITDESNNVVEINIGDLPSGLYFFNLESDDSVSPLKKLVKL
jgi:Ricin-type beta-trefoil lectin domain-like/Secretion system C-terminal sorting domain